jgi:hypothetical protein
MKTWLTTKPDRRAATGACDSDAALFAAAPPLAPRRFCFQYDGKKYYRFISTY